MTIKSLLFVFSSVLGVGVAALIVPTGGLYMMVGAISVLAGCGATYLLFGEDNQWD